MSMGIQTTVGIVSALVVSRFIKNELSEAPLIYATGVAGAGVVGYIFSGIVKRVMK
jgi:hypothetical protein